MGQVINLSEFKFKKSLKEVQSSAKSLFEFEDAIRSELCEKFGIDDNAVTKAAYTFVSPMDGWDFYEKFIALQETLFFDTVYTAALFEYDDAIKVKNKIDEIQEEWDWFGESYQGKGLDVCDILADFDVPEETWQSIMLLVRRKGMYEEGFDSDNVCMFLSVIAANIP